MENSERDRAEQYSGEDETETSGEESNSDQEDEAILYIEDLPGFFGFRETDKLVEYRPRLVEAMSEQNEQVMKKLAEEYMQIVEEVVDSNTENLQRFKAQIGSLIHTALLYNEGDLIDEAYDDLEAAFIAIDALIKELTDRGMTEDIPQLEVIQKMLEEA